MVLVSNTDGEILEPGKTYKIRASTDESIPKIVEAERRTILKSQYALADNCELTAKYIEATGQKVVRVQPFMCDTPPEKGGLPLVNLAYPFGTLVKNDVFMPPWALTPIKQSCVRSSIRPSPS